MADNTVKVSVTGAINLDTRTALDIEGGLMGATRSQIIDMACSAYVENFMPPLTQHIDMLYRRLDELESLRNEFEQKIKDFDITKPSTYAYKSPELETVYPLLVKDLNLDSSGCARLLKRFLIPEQSWKIEP